MSQSTLRSLLGVLVLVLVVALAWARFSRTGWSMFPAGRPAVNPADRLAQQPSTGLEGNAAVLAGSPPGGVSEDRHPPLADTREPRAPMDDGRANLLRNERLHPHRTLTSESGAAETSGTAALVSPSASIALEARSAGAPAVVNAFNASASQPPTTAIAPDARVPSLEAERFAAAVSSQRAGHVENARAQYQAVLASNSGDSGAHNNLGLLYQSQGRMSEAIGEFQRALALEPSYAKASNNLAVAFLQAGRPAEATSELRRLLAQDPRNAEAMTNLAVIYQSGSRTEEARELLQGALRINNRLATAHYNLALILEQNSEIVSAVEHYTSFLEHRGREHASVAEAVARHVVERQAWLLQQAAYTRTSPMVPR